MVRSRTKRKNALARMLSASNIKQSLLQQPRFVRVLVFFSCVFVSLLPSHLVCCSCASASALLDKLPGHDGQPVDQVHQSNALYLRKIASQIRPLHLQLVSGSGRFRLTTRPEDADLFYVPAFFSLLFWVGSMEAARCATRTFDVLRLGRGGGGSSKRRAEV